MVSDFINKENKLSNGKLLKHIPCKRQICFHPKLNFHFGRGERWLFLLSELMRERIFFQEDGTPPHKSRNIENLQKELFQIYRFERSCMASSLNFIFTLKGMPIVKKISKSFIRQLEIFYARWVFVLC